MNYRARETVHVGDQTVIGGETYDAKHPAVLSHPDLFDVEDAPRRGRPPGARNKPKPDPSAAAADDASDLSPTDASDVATLDASDPPADETDQDGPAADAPVSDGW